MLNENLIPLKDAAPLLRTSPAALAQRAWRARHAGSVLGLDVLQPAGPRTRRYLRRSDLRRFLDTLTDLEDAADRLASGAHHLIIEGPSYRQRPRVALDTESEVRNAR